MPSARDETNSLLARLYGAMIDHEAANMGRIGHFMKVYTYARFIGLAENLCTHTQFILESAALAHDIGIRPALEQYHSAAGPYQESLGAQKLEALLPTLGYNADDTRRIAFLVGHHHSTDGVDGMDWRILLEADFLVNAHEGSMNAGQIAAAKSAFFRTARGTQLLEKLYPAP